LKGENFGKVPAQGVTGLSAIVFGPVGAPSFPDDDTLFKGPTRGVESTGVIGPGQTWRIRFSGLIVREDHIARFAAGTHAFYFVGRVKYGDEFKPRRTTWFRFNYDRSSEGRLGICPVYNKVE
jgi:hypothetical protein